MKKKLLTAAILLVSAALLVAASILGTLSFLASSSAVSNTFTYGDVGIHMLESKVDEYGVDLDNTVSGVNARTVDGNSYKLVPNTSYVKDPAIFVKADSVPSYLFVKVKNGISTLESEEVDTMKEQMIAYGWQRVKENDAGEELYLYIGTGANATIPATTDDAKALSVTLVGDSSTEVVYPIFDKFTVKENAVVSDYGGAKVTLTAFAIQVKGYENDSAESLAGYQRAWNAIVRRFPFESGTEFKEPVVTP